MANSVTIYALCDPDSGEVRYVGRAANPQLRFRQHLTTFQMKSAKSAWILDLLEHGMTPAITMLETVEASEADRIEYAYIQKLRGEGARLTNAEDLKGSGGPTFTLRLSSTLYEALVALARRDRRRLADYVRVTLERHVEQHKQADKED